MTGNTRKRQRGADEDDDFQAPAAKGTRRSTRLGGGDADLDREDDAPASTATRRSSRIPKKKADISEEDITAKQTVSTNTGRSKQKGQYVNRSLTQLEKIQKILDDLKVNAHSVGPIPRFLEDNLDSFFNVPLPSINDRVYIAAVDGFGVPVLIRKDRLDDDSAEAADDPAEDDGDAVEGGGRARWALDLDGPNESNVSFEFVENGIVDFTNDAVRRQLGSLLERFCNAFGQQFPVPKLTGLLTDVADLALARIDSRTAAIKAPFWSSTKGFKLNIPYIDEDTGVKKLFDFTTAVGYALSTNLPRLPPDAKLYIEIESVAKIKSQQSISTVDLQKDAGNEWASVVPSDVLDGTAQVLPKHMSDTMDPTRLLATEKLMRVISWKMSNLRSTDVKMKLLRDHLVRVYTTDHTGGKTKMALSGLINVFRDVKKGYFVLGASASMIKGLGFDIKTGPAANKLKVRLYSLDTRWPAKAVEYVNKVYEDTGVMFDALIEMVKTVEIINAQIRNGSSPPSLSICTPDTPPDMKTCTTHPCGVCWRDVECDQRMRTADGLWVDKECHKKEEALGGFALVRTKKGVLQAHKTEAASLGQKHDDDNNQTIYDECVADIQQRHNAADPPAGSYVDGYSGITFPLTQGHHPFNKVVDCVLPSRPDGQGQLRGHIKGNVLDTTVSLNMGKGWRERNLPADLQSISNYRREIIKQPDGAQKTQLKQTLLQACDEHNQVSCKNRMNPAAALGQTVTAPVYAGMRTEFVTGKVNAVDISANEAAKKNAERVLATQNITTCGWTQDEIDQILVYANEAGVVEYADDGAPWPFPDVAMPVEFRERGLDILFSFLTLHLDRMIISCNRHWVTVDTTLSLAAEMFWQLWLDSEKEFLGLPLSPFLWHSLLISIGHLHHGQQMRTGYGRMPASLFDRNAALGNTVFEAQLSNNFKWDYAERYYPELQEYMAKLQVPKEFYDPTLALGGSSFAGQVDASELDYAPGAADQWAGEEDAAEGAAEGAAEPED